MKLAKNWQFLHHRDFDWSITCRSVCFHQAYFPLQNAFSLPQSKEPKSSSLWNNFAWGKAIMERSTNTLKPDITYFVSGSFTVQLTSCFFLFLIHLVCVYLINNRITCLVESKPVKKEISWAVIIPLSK